MTDSGSSARFGKCREINFPMAVGTSHDRDLAGACAEVMHSTGNDVIQTSGFLVMREDVKCFCKKLPKKYTP